MLPTTIEEADVTEVTDVLPEVRVPVEVVEIVDEPTVTDTTVVPEAIPVPDTVLPTAIEEADVT